MKYTTIYVDIESLLDLRQGYYATKPELYEQAADYLLSDAYNFRETDELKFLAPGEFKRAMLKPSLSYLDGSIVSYILSQIKVKIDRLEMKNKLNNEHTEPQVILNVYPFEMSIQQQRHIRDLLSYRLGGETLTHVVRLRPDEVDPGFFRDNGVASAFIYDYRQWLDLNLQKCASVPVKDVNLYFPALYPNTPSEEDLKAFKKTGHKDGFSYLETLTSGILSVSFLPVALYSSFLVATHYLSQYSFDTSREMAKLTPEEDSADGDGGAAVQVP